MRCSYRTSSASAIALAIALMPGMPTYRSVVVVSSSPPSLSKLTMRPSHLATMRSRSQPSTTV